MDEFEKYDHGCLELAAIIWNKSLELNSYLDKLFQEKDDSFMELVSFRKRFIGEDELLKYEYCLWIGYFVSEEEDERLACYCVLFDIDTFLIRYDYSKRFESYSKEQPIFVIEPSLTNHIRVSKNQGKPDNELICLNALNQIVESEIVSFNKHYFKTVKELNPLIISWSGQNFDSKNIYVRLNPHEVYGTQPDQRLFEAIIHPANPNWWKNLSIPPISYEGCSYSLDDCDPKVDYNKFWEKRIKRIERLEVKANRGTDGLLSMLIEEVCAINSDGHMINRVIHMDTYAPCGTLFKEAKLEHLDIAIYVYKDENAEIRNEENISNGSRSTEADYKCHLLRVDNLPFSSLFGFASYFLKSKTLQNEWINDQFKELI